ncbi:MAG: hypothetical protein GF364_05545, partial [Candidatus Lokiarchaeota archaeon]|nr:hypothetical protein [Candidatus Lokiarchaeota archaeon]
MNLFELFYVISFMQTALGKVIITPPKFLGGYKGHPMAGYTPMPTCKGKYDDIYAHAVLFKEKALDNVNKYFLIISMDVLQLPMLYTEYIKEKIEEKYQIHPNQILIHATHTHKSFCMTGMFAFGGNYPGIIKGIFRGSYHKWTDKYRVWIAKQIVKLIGHLTKKLRPSKIGWCSQILHKPIARNRVFGTRMDQPMNIISIKDKNTNEIYGIICNYGAHPTTMGGRSYFMSAEFPGRFVESIKKRSNNKIDGIWFTGPAGNVGPYFGGLYRLAKQQKFIRKPDGTRVKRRKYIITEKMGDVLAEDALKFAKDIPNNNYYNEIHFKGYMHKFWVPMKNYDKHWKTAIIRFNNAIVHWVKKSLLIPIALALADSNEPNFPGFALKHKKREINIYSEVQYIKISGKNDHKTDEIALVGVPGELFTDIADKIYKNSLTKPDHTFIFQASNDWIAYLFPLKHYVSRGGYEPLASFGPLCGAY